MGRQLQFGGGRRAARHRRAVLAFDVGGMRGRLLAGSSSGGVPAGVPVEIKSIAVLPFADLSPEQDQGYFAEGISEEILNLLAQRTEPHVIARTSSFSLKQREADIAEIAKTLGVSHLLDGSVRKDGNRIRIAARLVDPESGTQLWSDSYDRELGDILNVQAEIAVAVAAALDVELGIGAAGVAADPRIDPQAFDLYLQGLQQIRSWTAHSLVHAESSFRQSVEREPRFVRAWYGLGLALLLQVIHEVEPLRDNLPGMRELVARGLELDPDNAGLTALKGQIARYDGDSAPAERYLEQALQLDPSDVWVRNLYCFFKMDRGQPQAALAAQRRTLEIDPLNPTVYVAIGFSQLDLGNPEQALAAAQRFRELNDPGNPTAAGMNAVMKIVLWGDYAGAVRDALHGMSRLPPDERTWEECFPRGADEDSMVCRFVAEFLPKGSNRGFHSAKTPVRPLPSLDPCPA